SPSWLGGRSPRHVRREKIAPQRSQALGSRSRPVLSSPARLFPVAVWLRLRLRKSARVDMTSRRAVAVPSDRRPPSPRPSRDGDDSDPSHSEPRQPVSPFGIGNQRASRRGGKAPYWQGSCDVGITKGDASMTDQAHWMNDITSIRQMRDELRLKAHL